MNAQSIFYLLLIGLFCNINLILGDYSIGSYYIEAYDPYQVDHAVRGSVHYPSNQKPGDKFPVIVFSPGFIFSDSFYDYLFNLFVPQGYIMIIEGSYDYDIISTPLWKAKDMAFLLDYVTNASKNDPKIPFYGTVGDAALSMGHSEGGQASILTANPASLKYLYHANYSATIVLSGCFGWPDQTIVHDALTSLKTPIMWITGTDDCVCTPSFQLSEYKYTLAACKYFANLVNGSHCYFASADPIDAFLCYDLEVIGGCGFNPKMDMSLQQKLVLRYSFPYIEWQLKGNKTAKAQLDQYLAQDQQQKLITYVNTPCS